MFQVLRRRIHLLAASQVCLPKAAVRHMNVHMRALCCSQVGRGNIQQAAEAIAGAFTLAGGPGPALSAVRQLGSIVQAVGCTAPLTGGERGASGWQGFRTTSRPGAPAAPLL